MDNLGNYDNLFTKMPPESSFCMGYPHDRPTALLNSIDIDRKDVNIRPENRGGHGFVIPGKMHSKIDGKTYSVVVKFPNQLFDEGVLGLSQDTNGKCHLFKKPIELLKELSADDDMTNEIRMYNLLTQGADVDPIDGRYIPKDKMHTAKNIIDKIRAFHAAPSHPGMHRLMQILDFDLSIPCLVSYRYDGNAHDFIGQFTQSTNIEDRIAIQAKIKANLDNFMLHLMRGFMYMHSQNIAHQDMKPGNIFYHVVHDGQINFILGDFGSCSDPDKTSILQWEPDGLGTWGCILPCLLPSFRDLSAFPIYRDLYAYCTSVQSMIHLVRADATDLKLKWTDITFDLIVGGGVGEFYSPFFKDDPVHTKLEIIREGVLRKAHFRRRTNDMAEITFMIRPVSCDHSQPQGMLKEYIDFCKWWLDEKKFVVERADIDTFVQQLLSIQDRPDPHGRMRTRYELTLRNNTYNNIPACHIARTPPRQALSRSFEKMNLY